MLGEREKERKKSVERSYAENGKVTQEALFQYTVPTPKTFQ